MTGRPTQSLVPGVSRAEELLERARIVGDRGRPAQAVALCRRALLAVSRSGGPTSLRTRILVTLSFNLSESGDVAGALATLEQTPDDRVQQPTLLAARGTVLLRNGDLAGSIEHLNRAVPGLAGGDAGDLATALLNRGAALMSLTDFRAAQADTEAAAEVAAGAGLDIVVFMARYNLGYLRFLAGDLPGSLQAMGEAERLAPEAALGVPALDRARVLLAAGLVGEAGEYAKSAIDTFTRNRSMTNLTDALLVGGDIAIVAGDAQRAHILARRAVRISARRRNPVVESQARLLDLRAAAVVRRSAQRAGKPVALQRSRRAADAAADLADRLSAAGRPNEAGTARLLAVESMLDVGDVAGAGSLYRTIAGATRRMPIAGRLQSDLMGARLALATGRRPDGLRQLRRGLDDLGRFQALFGSQDLQAASAVWGRQLAGAGLRAAVETGSAAQVLQWLERARASSTRLGHLRPPADPVLAADLGALRLAEAEARAAVLAGRADPAREREVAEIRRRIRTRTWTLSGSGSLSRPPTLRSVQRSLADGRGGAPPVVLAYFTGAGSVHALVITATTARYHRLIGLERCEELTQVAAADLELLAAGNIPGPLRRVAQRSLDSTLRMLSEDLVEPLLSSGTGQVLVSGTGPLGAMPWSLLPSLAGRAVSATTSVSAGIAGLAPCEPAHTRGVLAVAGPQVEGADVEVRAVVDRHPGAVALTGLAATGAGLLSNVPPQGLVHIAAHGHHTPDSPLFSSVLLADGPLFAYDIAPNPTLPDQVVLSSCDVGRASVRWESEPLGLAVALLRSGIRTVIAAVAPISDRAATAVMTRYHDEIAAGAGPAAALAAALPQAGETPAPFTCFGSGTDTVPAVAGASR